MENLKKILILLTIVIYCSACNTETTSPLWDNLETGSYDVGFKTIFLFDSTRSFAPEGISSSEYNARPVRIMVWYPGDKDNSAKKMNFSDYINVKPTDYRFEKYNDILRNRDLLVARYQFSPLSDSLLNILLNTQIGAVKNINHTEGLFPLILYATGMGDFQQENTVLWEYLASHGYITAVLPEFGHNIDQLKLPFSEAGLNLQIEDFEFALSELLNHPNVDTSRIGFIGHSFGGLVAWQFAITHRNIQTVVSLDGSINQLQGHKILRSLKERPSELRIPILNMYTLDQGERDLSIIDSALNADCYHVLFKNASHYDFQNWPLYAVLTNAPDDRTLKLRSSETGKDIFLAVVKLTKKFLDGTLKNDESALNIFYGKSDNLVIPDSLAAFRVMLMN